VSMVQRILRPLRTRLRSLQTQRRISGSALRRAGARFRWRTEQTSRGARQGSRGKRRSNPKAWASVALASPHPVSNASTCTDTNVILTKIYWMEIERYSSSPTSRLHTGEIRAALLSRSRLGSCLGGSGQLRTSRLRHPKRLALSRPRHRRSICFRRLYRCHAAG